MNTTIQDTSDFVHPFQYDTLHSTRIVAYERPSPLTKHNIIMWDKQLDSAGKVKKALCAQWGVNERIIRLGIISCFISKLIQDFSNDSPN